MDKCHTKRCMHITCTHRSIYLVNQKICTYWLRRRAGRENIRFEVRTYGPSVARSVRSDRETYFPVRHDLTWSISILSYDHWICILSYDHWIFLIVFLLWIQTLQPVSRQMVVRNLFEKPVRCSAFWPKSSYMIAVSRNSMKTFLKNYNE